MPSSIGPSLAVALTLAAGGGCGRAWFEETGDASVDAMGLDARGPDAGAPEPDAPEPDAPGLDAPVPDAPGLDAPGLDAPGLDAWAPDAPFFDDAPSDAPPTLPDAFRFDAGPLGPHNVAFLSHPVAGDFGGLAGADAICAADAIAAGLPGTFVAVLGVDGSAPLDRLGTAEGWVRPDGRLVATSRAALDAPLVHPVTLTAAGDFVERASAWIGTDDDCARWTSTTGSGSAGHARSVLADEWRSLTTGAPCSARVPLYCFQIDLAGGAPAPSPTAGRRVFVSDPAPAGTSPDEACEASRVAAGLTSGFRAFVAGDGVSALSRVTLDGRPWVRMDGLVVFLGDADAAGGRATLAPVLFDARGVALRAFLHGGADRPTRAGDLTASCQLWTSTDSTVYVPIGESDRVGNAWFGDATSGCRSEYRFYCLED